MILIINTTSDTSVTAELKRMLDEKALEADIVEAAQLDISPCIGCNHCWLKTPGICAIKDDYEMILKKVIHADQLWVISGTSFGFIDHRGKNIFDRILPVMTMYIKFEGGQMRHVMRYDRKIDIGVIYTEGGKTDFLNRWIGRVALNLGSSPLGAFGKNQIKEAVSCMC